MLKRAAGDRGPDVRAIKRRKNRYYTLIKAKSARKAGEEERREGGRIGGANGSFYIFFPLSSAAVG